MSKERGVLAKVMAELAELGRLNEALQARIAECDAQKSRLLSYERIVQTTHDHVAALDRDYRYQAVSNSYLIAHLKPVEEIVGHTVAELLGEQIFTELVKPRFDRCLAGEVVNYQAWFTFPGFGRRYMDVTYYPVWDREANEVRGLVVNSHDLTSLHESQASERLAKTVFESTGEGILITDAAANIICVNPAFTAISGYTSEEAVGRNPGFAKSGRHDQVFYQAMWDALEKTGQWRGEIWDRRKNGSIYPKYLTINAVRDESGKAVNYVGIFSDISELKQMQDQLKQLAYYDVLTGLPNRMSLREQLKYEISRAQRNNQAFAVLFIDLDEFKYVNDSYGHSAGDQLLVEVARRLQGCVRLTDTVARLGGDEFMVILENTGLAEQVVKVAEVIIKRLGEPFTIGDSEVCIGASIGIFICPHDGNDPEAILSAADTAMYHAKGQGKGGYQFYSPELNSRVRERMTLDSGLRKALKRDELYLEYQPQVSAHDGSLVAVEALLRWRHPKYGILMPEQFIPLAIETGLINPIGIWVLQQALEQGGRWWKAGLSGVPVAVNVSKRQFWHYDTAGEIRRMLLSGAQHGQTLELELSESDLMETPEHNLRYIHELSEMGVRFSLDNLGSSRTSLMYLKRLPIGKLKLAMPLVAGLEECADLVTAVIGMAKVMQMHTVAMGVEDERQLAQLRSMGCDYIQGWVAGAPMSADALMAWHLNSLIT